MNTKTAQSLMDTYLVLVIVFCSGASGLIYEISWSRQIGAFFGHSVTAASITLAAYFAGMAFGYAAGGLRFARRVSPLRAYGWLEIFIGLYALALPWVLEITDACGSSWINNSTSHIVLLAARSVTCFIVLLPATFAMGFTLLMITNWVTRRFSHISTASEVASLRSFYYAINTFGGLLGVLASTFIFLATVGVARTSYLAAAVSLACGSIALLVDKTFPLQAWAIDEQPVKDTKSGRRVRYSFYLLSGISGFVTLAAQVLYVRLFTLVFHNSTYTFGAVITVFLASLTVGAFVESRLQRQSRFGTLVNIATTIGGLLLITSVIVFLCSTQLSYFSVGDSFATYFVSAIVLVTFVVGPPISLLAMILPTTWRMASGATTQGNEVGSLTCVNAVAAAVGALTANFVLLPFVGLWGSFILLATLLLASSLAFSTRPLNRVWVATSALALVALSVGLTKSANYYDRLSLGKSETLVKRWHSSYGLIDLTHNEWSGVSKIRQNLHYRFGATGKSAREYRQANIPLLLHPQPANVLFLGMGTGLTAGAAITHEQVATIDVVELIPEVAEAARLLRKENYGLIESEKVHVHIQDARDYVRSTNKRFDVIVSDLFVPWESETGYLYTVEHYQLVRERLTSKGLFCQCLPLYQLGPVEFELIADSIASVFTTVEIWWIQLDADKPIVALLAYDDFQKTSSEGLQARLDQLWKVVKSTDETIGNKYRLLGLYQGNWPRRSDQLLNTDEHPRVEFLNPISHRDGRMLSRRNLEEYYDRVFENLPFVPTEVTLEGDQSSTKETNRASLRFMLFQN